MVTIVAVSFVTIIIQAGEAMVIVNMHVRIMSPCFIATHTQSTTLNNHLVTTSSFCNLLPCDRMGEGVNTDDHYYDIGI